MLILKLVESLNKAVYFNLKIGLGLDIKADPKMLTKNDPTGKKIDMAIATALLNVSNKFRGLNSKDSNTKILASERISNNTLAQKMK
jgi:hypothetical protein